MGPIPGMTTGLIAGATGSLAQDKIKEKIEAVLPHDVDAYAEFVAHFPQHWEKMMKELHSIAQAEGLVPILKTINLFQYPSEYQLQDYGRAHISLFLTAGVQVRLFVSGVGIYQPTLNAGWNALDITPGSTISLVAVAGPIPALLQASDASLGPAI